MKGRSVMLAGGVAALVAAGTIGLATAQAQAAVVPPNAVSLAAAPYLFPAAGGNVNPVSVMTQTKVKAFTLAFIIARGKTTCQPAWDGTGSITSGPQMTTVNNIRKAGGDVVVSFGGAAGDKLGNACPSASALAGAYQKVINALKLRAIDIDMEAREVSQGTKILQALKIVKQKNPGIQVIVTLGVGTGGLEGGELNMLKNAGKMAGGSPVDLWTIMPFDFGNANGANMGNLTKSVSDKFHAQMKTALKKSDAEIFRMQGISSMNGKTDVGETVKVSDFRTMLGYANLHHIGRFTFWTTNRDRGNCGGTSDTCSGISQKPLDFTKVIGQYNG